MKHFRELALEVIEQALYARERCTAKCKTIAYRDACVIVLWDRWRRGGDDLWITTDETRNFMRAHGFEEDSASAGYIRRCDKCEATPIFPWASELDLDKVANFIEHDPRCRDGGYEIAILEETLAPPKYKFPVSAKVETGQLPACERCGLLSHNGLKGSPAYEHMKRAGCVLEESDGGGFKLL